MDEVTPAWPIGGVLHTHLPSPSQPKTQCEQAVGRTVGPYLVPPGSGESHPGMVVELGLGYQGSATPALSEHRDVDRTDAPSWPGHSEQDLGMKRPAEPIGIEVGHVIGSEPAGDEGMSREAHHRLLTVAQLREERDPVVHLGESAGRGVAEDGQKWVQRLKDIH